MQLTTICWVRCLKMSNCRQLRGLDASKCATVNKISASMTPNDQLSSTSGARCLKVCNCRKHWGCEASKCATVDNFVVPEASKCVIVVDLFGSMPQNVQR